MTMSCNRHVNADITPHVVSPDLPSAYYACGGVCTNVFCLDVLLAPSVVMPLSGQELIMNPVFVGAGKAYAYINISMDGGTPVTTRADANGNYAYQWLGTLDIGTHTACVTQSLGQCVSPPMCVTFSIVDAAALTVRAPAPAPRRAPVLHRAAPVTAPAAAYVSAASAPAAPAVAAPVASGEPQTTLVEGRSLIGYPMSTGFMY